MAVPLAVGLYALYRPPFERFGALLALTGCVWFLTTLSNSDDAALYSIGRVSGWAVEPLFVYLLLAFPTGRPESQRSSARRHDGRAGGGPVSADRVGGRVLSGTGTVDDVLRATAPTTRSCVTHSEPAVVENVVRPVREVVFLLLYVAVAVRLAQRIRGASRLTRRTVAPVLGVAGLRCGVYAAAVVLRKLAPDSTAVEVWLWVLAFMIPLTCVAFLVGLARWWVFIAHSTRRLPPGSAATRGLTSSGRRSPRRSTTRRWRSCTGSRTAIGPTPPAVSKMRRARRPRGA